MTARFQAASRRTKGITRKWGAAAAAGYLQSVFDDGVPTGDVADDAVGGARAGGTSVTDSSTGAGAAEQRLVEFYANVQDAGRPLWRHVLRRPRAALGALRDTRALP